MDQGKVSSVDGKRIDLYKKKKTCSTEIPLLFSNKTFLKVPKWSFINDSFEMTQLLSVDSFFARWFLFHSASNHKPLHHTQSIIFHRAVRRTERKLLDEEEAWKWQKCEGEKKSTWDDFFFSFCAWNFFFRQIFLFFQWGVIELWYFIDILAVDAERNKFFSPSRSKISRGTNYHKNQVVAKLDDSFLRLSNA